MDEKGQSTLEFLVVTLAFLAVVIGMGAITDAMAGGLMVDKASENAAYVIDDADGLSYVLMF